MRRAVLFLVFVLLLPTLALAHGDKTPKGPNWGIVLAAFGSVRPEARAALDNVRAAMEDAFPGVPVRMGYSSRMVRGQLKVPSPLTVMSQLADEGRTDIVVVPLYVTAGDEYLDLLAQVRVLHGLTHAKVNKPPFTRVVLCDPALGSTAHGDARAMARTARALKADADAARAAGAALVYAGHGNPRRPAWEMAAFQSVLRKTSPGLVVAVGSLDATPGLEDVIKSLKAAKARKVLLYPLLFVSGAHVDDDLCGAGKDTWKNALEAAGFSVECLARGLGESPDYAAMLVERARAAMGSAR